MVINFVTESGRVGIDPFVIASKKFAAESVQGAKGRHAKNIFGRLSYSLIVAVAGLVSSRFVFGGVPMYGFVVLSLSLVTATTVAVYVGWQALSEYQIFSAIPVAKIDGAAHGMSEISGNFAPESAKAIGSPIGNSKCVYYKLELHYKTSGKNSHDYVEWSHQEGVPSLIYDNTGYLCGDYTTAEFGFYTDTYTIRDKKWFDTDFRNNIFKALDSINSIGDKLDLTPFSNEISLGAPRTKVFYDSLGISEEPAGYYMRMTYLPSDVQYFVIGNISDSGKSYNDKPVKQVSVDPRSGIFSIVPEPKQNVISKLRNYAMINFCLAVVYLVTVIFIYNWTSY